MVAYSFQKRFTGFIEAGLEPGPWCPGMKRHTLRRPREGRSRHARPEQAVQLYTGMRTKHCRLIGRAVCRLCIPVRLVSDGRRFFTLVRREGPAPRSYVMQSAPIVRVLLDLPIGDSLGVEEMDAFARTDGFADRADMQAFFDPPKSEEVEFWSMDLVLIGWAPGTPHSARDRGL